MAELLLQVDQYMYKTFAIYLINGRVFLVRGVMVNYFPIFNSSKQDIFNYYREAISL